MSREIFFFATKADMLKGLKEIELKRKVKYIENGSYDSEKQITEFTFDNIPNLGINTSGNHISESYLILDDSVPVVTRGVKQSAGGVKYFIDQKENKTSIVLWPGGFYGTDYLINGHIATISDDPISLDLYKCFTKLLTKGFKQYGRYRIGPEAHEMIGKIRFITININQPKEYDFKLEQRMNT